MENTTIHTYVSARLKSGERPVQVRQDLILVGWSELEVAEALKRALVSSGVPTPTNEQGEATSPAKLASTVEVVLNLFSFILLVVLAIGLGVLSYQIINRYFPDALALRSGAGGFSTEVIHYAMAVLIVTFPLYFFTMRIWFRRFRDDQDKVESKLTKWLTYLVLLAAAVTIVGDLIVALFFLLQGEISVRFALKAMVILLISGTIFGFYFLERKKIQYKRDIPRRTFLSFGWVTLALVVVAILLGFAAGGSPSTERKRGFDSQRADDLRSIAGCISQYGMNQRALPASLEELATSGMYSYCAAQIQDPETGSPYEYRVVGTTTEREGVRNAEFELCAVFTLDTTVEGAVVNTYSYPYSADKWSIHGVGRSCDIETTVIAKSIESDMLIKAPTPVYDTAIY